MDKNERERKMQDLEAVRKRARAYESYAEEHWKRAADLEKELYPPLNSTNPGGRLCPHCGHNEIYHVGTQCMMAHCDCPNPEHLKPRD